MRQIKTSIAGNSQSIAKIGNAELAHFNKQMLIHELIRGSSGIVTPICRFKIIVTGTPLILARPRTKGAIERLDTV
jgi:hypothetical protein